MLGHIKNFYRRLENKTIYLVVFSPLQSSSLHCSFAFQPPWGLRIKFSTRFVYKKTYLYSSCIYFELNMLASRSQLNASQLRQWNKAKFTREKSHTSSHHHHHILARETDVSSNADANAMLERGSVTTIVSHLNSTLS